MYQDQAEITRELEINSLTLGEQYIAIEGASTSLKVESIRATGKGDASVLEVSFRTEGKEVVDPSVDQQEQERQRTAWEAQIAELTGKRKEIGAARELLNESQNFLESYVRTVSRVGGEGNTRVLGTLLDKKTLANVQHFSTFYTSQLATTDERRTLLEKESKEVDTRITELRRKINQLKPAKKHKVVREIIVLLQGHKEGSKATLSLHYVVSNVQWNAQYDIRVMSKDNTVELTYFALVTQSTNELWRNVDLSLSTATPSSKHAPPNLAAMVLQRQQQVYSQHYYGGMERGMELEESRYDSLQCENLKCERYSECDSKVQRRAMPSSFSAPLPPPPEMAVAKSTAQQGATSSTFNIERPSTIPSDKEPHKVTIGVIKLGNCKCEYITVPCMDQNAYLKVKATNTSDFTFLAGPMSVFFDNNYVAKSKLPTVSPSEEFEAFLGQDEAVKVEYKIPQKFRETKGIIINTTNKQRTQNKIVIKNNKQTKISLVVKDRFPESGTKDVVVKLLEPDFKDKQKLANVPLDKNNKADLIKLDNVMKHIDWELELAPNQKVTIGFTVELEWPSSKQIQFSG